MNAFNNLSETRAQTDQSLNDPYKQSEEGRQIFRKTSNNFKSMFLKKAITKLNKSEVNLSDLDVSMDRSDLAPTQILGQSRERLNHSRNQITIVKKAE